MSKYISKKWKRSRKKFSQLTIIVLALFIGLGVLEFPISSEKNVVHAASKSTNAGFSLWSNFEKTAMQPGVASNSGKLYWGNKNNDKNQPMLWNIISAEDTRFNTGGVTLFYTGDFGVTVFNNGNVIDYEVAPDDVRIGKNKYPGSVLEGVIDIAEANSLNSLERKATVKSSISNSGYQLRGIVENGATGEHWIKAPNNAVEEFKDKLWFAPTVSMFPLTYKDYTALGRITFGFLAPEIGNSNYWTSTGYRRGVSSGGWLPPNGIEDCVMIGTPKIHSTSYFGTTVTEIRHNRPNTANVVARPATNIKITNENTLLITNADAKKSGIGENALTAVPTSGNGTYKLTLKDPSQTLTVNSVKMGKGNKATVSYMRGSDKGTSLSAIVTDKNDNVVSYGRIKSFSGSGGIGGGTALGGTTDIVLPSNFKEDGYKLKLFTEIYNGDNQTDYASNIVEATVEFPEVEFSMNYIEDGQTKAEIFHSFDIGDTQFGTTFNDPGKPSRRGYVFGGWYKDTACTEDQKWNFATDIIPLKHQGKMTLYAKWTIVDYSINYDLKPPSETNEQLSSITNPNASRNGYQVITPEFKISAPTLKGYTFKGWTEKITVGGAESDKDNPLTGESGVVNTDKSITIKKGSIGNRQYEAAWQRDSHNVQIVSNGGTYDGNDKINDVLYKNEIKIGGLTPPKGKKFIRWQLNNGSDATISGDSQNGYTLRMGTGNVILTAIYEGIDYKLTFSANGGSGTGKELLHKMGEQVTLPGVDVAGTKSKSKLIGWNTNADGSGTHYDVGATYTMPDSNTTLYAEWEGSYSITYNIGWSPNTHWVGTADRSDRIAIDQDTYTALLAEKPDAEDPEIILEQIAVKENYYLAGWTTRMGVSNTLIKDGTKLTDDITLYAHFKGKLKDVTFDANGGKGTMAPQKINYSTLGGDAKALTKNTFTRAGYTFTGWNTNKDGSGKSIADEAKYLMNTNGITLYAQWEAIEYSIGYDLNVPEGEIGNIDNSINQDNTTYNVTSTPFTIGVPTLTGYTFTGWTEVVTKGGAGTDKDTALSGYNGVQNNDHTVTVNTGSIGNRKYKANWKINEYKLTLDLNGGTYSDSSIPTEITMPYKTKVSLTNPTPPDKKVFTNWKVIGNPPLDGGFGIGDEKNTYTMGAGNVTVQAQYKDMNQSIKFTDDTETMLKNNTYAYGEEFVVEAEAIEVNGDMPDKTKGIVFSTQDIDYLEIVGEPTWDPSTFKAKATFKVVKPLPEGNANTLTIEINKPETDTHNAAQQVSSSDVKTEKRKIDLKIDSNLYKSTFGTERLSMKVGEVLPEIENQFIVTKPDVVDVDAIAEADRNAGKIPYSVTTTHYIGDYKNNANKNVIPTDIEKKILAAANGNIWYLGVDFSSKASQEKKDWFNERYTINKKSEESIIDVFDHSNGSNRVILFANDMLMSLAEYKSKLSNLDTETESGEEAFENEMISLSKFAMTNDRAPYKEATGSFGGFGDIIINNQDEHAGTYAVDANYVTLKVSSELKIFDFITENLGNEEKLVANTYIHQKGQKWSGAIFSSEYSEGWDRLAKIELYDLKTGLKKDPGDNIAWTVEDKTAWQERGETTLQLTTEKGTTLESKIIVRDHAVSTNDIRVSANDLALSRDEATALVNELSGKSIKEQVSILTPTDPESKYGMYPYATNYVTGNRVLINNITGLPEISTSTGKVEAGVYDVTFETAGGGTVTAQIKVRTADPTAYVEIPAKIKLKKSSESNIVAEETDVVKLKTGVGVELDALKETILVETPSSFILKGISPSNTTTELNVDVYTQGENGETKHDGTVPFATLDSKNTEKQYILRIMKTLPKHRKDLYVGKMNFKISFGKAVSEGGG